MGTNSNDISPKERMSLEVEYEIAHNRFQGTNVQIWQTFSVVAALGLAGLAFIGTLKTGKQTTWLVTLGVGVAIITILYIWLRMAQRWEAYSQVDLYRMREIECQYGLYLIRYGTWLRKPLNESEIAVLSDEEKARYNSIRKAFPDFPGYGGRQQRLITYIVIMLIVIWILTIALDCLSLI